MQLAKPLVPPLLSHGPHQPSLHVNPTLGSQRAFEDLPCIRVGTDSDGYAWLEVEDYMLFDFVDGFLDGLNQPRAHKIENMFI